VAGLVRTGGVVLAGRRRAWCGGAAWAPPGGRGVDLYSLAAVVRVTGGRRLPSWRRVSVLRWWMAFDEVQVQGGDLVRVGTPLR
jgi:hypothetical protein